MPNESVALHCGSASSDADREALKGEGGGETYGSGGLPTAAFLVGKTDDLSPFEPHRGRPPEEIFLRRYTTMPPYSPGFCVPVYRHTRGDLSASIPAHST